MHMALRRMNGWIQEMERKRSEGDILDRSCVQIEKKKCCFEARRDMLLFFPLPVKGREGSALQRGLRGVVSVTAAVGHAGHLQASFCF